LNFRVQNSIMTLINRERAHNISNHEDELRNTHNESNDLPAYILALIYNAVKLARPLILVKERLKRM